MHNTPLQSKEFFNCDICGFSAGGPMHPVLPATSNAKEVSIRYYYLLWTLCSKSTRIATNRPRRAQIGLLDNLVPLISTEQCRMQRQHYCPWWATTRPEKLQLCAWLVYELGLPIDQSIGQLMKFDGPHSKCCMQDQTFCPRRHEPG